MPLFTIDSTRRFSDNEKDEMASFITKATVSQLHVFPDKIQVLIHNVGKNDSYRGGYSPISPEFNIKSRINSQDFQESYYTDKFNHDEDLITIVVDSFSGFSFLDKSLLMKTITAYMVKNYNISGDNVVGFIHDISPENWFQNGTSGRDPEFLTKSRTPNE